MPANKKTEPLLTSAQKKALRWDNQADYLANSQLYPIPDATLDDLMQDNWTEMLQN
jgi:spermidine/putrescine transport system substrate-binding protein